MQHVWKCWARWSIGILAVVLSFLIGSKSAGINGVGGMWFGVFLLVVAATCIFPEILAAAVSPITRWIDSLYLPGGKPEPAPLSYRLVRYYQVTQRYDLAAAEYRRIIGDYPDEAEAYEGMLRLLVEEFGDRRAARHWLKRAFRNVQDREQQQRLHEKFGSLLEPQRLLISV